MDLYHSIAKVRKLKWNYAEAQEITDTVMGTAETLTRMGKDDFLTGDSLITEFEPGYIEGLLDIMTPENMIAAFVDPEFDQTRFDQSVQKQTDPYYEAEFKVMPLSTAFQGTIAEKWSKWLSEDPQSVRDSYMAEMGLNQMPIFKLPQAIMNIPENDEINLDYAKAPLGDDAITQIYGEKPKKKSPTQKAATRRSGTARDPLRSLPRST